MFCPISGDWGDTKFASDVSNEMLINAAKCQGYSFYRFRVIEEKTNGGWGKVTPPPRLGLIEVNENIRWNVCA